MSFELQPVLAGSLVRLRPLQPGDYEALYAVARDPLIWAQHPARDRHQPEVFRAFFEKALESGGAFLVEDAKTGEAIGSTRYYGYSAEHSEIEIGWTFLARSHWGGVPNGEMKRLMLDHAFRFVRSVVFLIGPENLRSQRAVEKIGAVRDGSRRDGEGRESYRFRIDAPETR